MKRIDISTGAIALLSVLYFFCGFEAFFALLTAVCVHELGHILAIKAQGGNIPRLRFDISGICMCCSDFKTRKSEFAALFSGPFSGIVFAFATSYFGNQIYSSFLLTASGFSLLLSLYNILPILPLDGGRMLLCLVSSVLSDHKAKSVCKAMSLILSALVTLIGGFNISTEWGAAICLAGMILLIYQMKSKGVL